jgi:type II restriction/modification system DNA methylase subunit YeeA
MIAQVARRHQPKADRKITSKSVISKIQKAYYQFQFGLFSRLSSRERLKQKNSRKIHQDYFANKMNLRR